jgi:hypothetical protein
VSMHVGHAVGKDMMVMMRNDLQLTQVIMIAAVPQRLIWGPRGTRTGYKDVCSYWALEHVACTSNTKYGRSTSTTCYSVLNDTWYKWDSYLYP